ncbi:MAG: tRNA-dihydrouridine synthase [Candidatus Kaiserbacteria bacterium]|nr:tRNA-dihydrouridine synthase [Candidatus Kaiserbacteria bacterium]
MRNFWQDLPRPFFALAPMEDVTDAAFRRLIAKYGKPHVFFTEFTSADGLALADEKGQRNLRKGLEYSEAERPIVAQLFSSSPQYMEQGAAIARELGFDGVDINMGCPVNEVVNQHCGAALIKDPARAREIIRATTRGAGDLPVSVKTRLGYHEDELDTWLPELLAEEPAVVTIHARTRKEMSAVPARWERVAAAVKIRDSLKSKTLIVGNGDVVDLKDASNKAAATGCDGVMLGRAIYGNPWLFADRDTSPTREEHIRALIEHIGLFQEHMSGFVNDALMKKHFKAYISGWDNAKELRMQLMDAASLNEAKSLLAAELGI